MLPRQKIKANEKKNSNNIPLLQSRILKFTRITPNKVFNDLTLDLELYDATLERYLLYRLTK